MDNERGTIGLESGITQNGQFSSQNNQNARIIILKALWMNQKDKRGEVEM